jgi:hypothetical protein
MAGIESDALIEMASRGPAADKQVRNATLWPLSQGHLAQRPFWGKFRLRLQAVNNSDGLGTSGVS